MPMPKLILFAISLVIASTIAVNAQLKIDGRLAVLDSTTNTYLCPTTIVNFGAPQEFEVTYEGLTDVKIDGNAVASGTTHTFAAITGGKSWTIEAMDGDTPINRQLTFTYLPVMVLNGTFGNEYTNATIQLLDPDDYTDELMLSQVKWRGATSNTEGKNKRNYHIKFIDETGAKMDRRFFGLRKDNSWIMDGGQVDFLRVRNRVATELWNDMCTKPYYADLEPQAKTGVDGQWVEVILNGRYVGLYALTEAMDRKLLKIKKFDEITKEIHGQIWKSKLYTSTTTFNIFVPYNNNLAEWAGFETKYPELDEVSPTNYKLLGDCVHLGDTATQAQFNEKAHLLFDMPVMIDYEIFTQALLTIDNHGKNIYWFTYDRETAPTISLAVWDLDTSMGGNWTTEAFHPSTVSPTRKLTSANTVFGRMTYPDSRYYRQCIQRYHELRKDVLSTDSLIARYTHAVEHIDKCGAIDREQARWSRDTDLSRRELNIRSELAYVTNWIKTRMDFLDNSRYKEPLTGDVNVDGVVDIADVNAAINVILTSNWLENPIADTNGDETVDIADVNKIINIILNTDK